MAISWTYLGNFLPLGRCSYPYVFVQKYCEILNKPSSHTDPNRPTYIEFAKKHLNSIMIGIKWINIEVASLWTLPRKQSRSWMIQFEVSLAADWATGAPIAVQICLYRPFYDSGFEFWRHRLGTLSFFVNIRRKPETIFLLFTKVMWVEKFFENREKVPMRQVRLVTVLLCQKAHLNFCILNH